MGVTFLQGGTHTGLSCTRTSRIHNRTHLFALLKLRSALITHPVSAEIANSLLQIKTYLQHGGVRKISEANVYETPCMILHTKMKQRYSLFMGLAYNMYYFWIIFSNEIIIQTCTIITHGEITHGTTPRVPTWGRYLSLLGAGICFFPPDQEGNWHSK